MRSFPKNKTIHFHFLFIGLLLFILPTLINAQEMRGLGKVNQQTTDTTKTGNYYLFMVGIDKYHNWMDLKNAVNDANGIREVLMENFGFQVPVPPLYNEEATITNIFKSFDELRKVVKKEDNLILFFAGHGYTRTDKIGEETIESGYLIPHDGDDPKNNVWSSYINMHLLLHATSLIPARHIILILDACHSGVALGNAATGFRSSASYATVLNNQISRRIITSARSKQLAQDNGPVPDHSLFTGMFIEGLRKGKADLDANGLITSTELGLFLEQEVTKYSDGMQSPDFGAFQLDKRGEMVFFLDAIPNTVLINNLHVLVRNGKLLEFVDLYPELKRRQLPLIQTFDLDFFYALMLKDLELAQKTLNEIILIKEEIDQHHLKNVIEFRPLLKYWAKFWNHYVPDPNIQLDLMVNGSTFNNIEHTLPSIERAVLPIECTYQFKFTNNGDTPKYIYAFYTDFRGGIQVLRLWDDLDLLKEKGLGIGETAISHQFRHIRQEGVEAIKFFFSTEPIPSFIFPPTFLRAELPTPIPPEGLKSKTQMLIFRKQ